MGQHGRSAGDTAWCLIAAHGFDPVQLHNTTHPVFAAAFPDFVQIAANPPESILKTPRIISEGCWVFESLSKPDFPVTGVAITRALERLRIKYVAEAAPFSPHDLRRSVTTGCAEYLDAPEWLIELLLNHVPKDRLIRTYQLGQMLRNIFLKWVDFIEYEIIQSGKDAPDNVVEVSFGRKRSSIAYSCVLREIGLVYFQ